MEYMLLIFESEKAWGGMSEAQKAAGFREYMTFTEDVKKKGHYKSGNPLQPTSTATTVRVRDGKTLATDGPYAETKEQLGGYYLVEAKDLDEAIAIASRVPGAKWGAIEVRPIQKM